MLPANFVHSNMGSRVEGFASPHDPRLRRSVFVGDLSFFCTEIDLANVFSRFGHVVTVEIKRGRHGDSLLHGFVEFDSDASAELAIQYINGRKWMGRTLRVNWTNISVATNPEQDSWIQVHVNFTCKDLSRKINEEFLETIFSSFGGLADVTVKRHGCTGHPLQTTGYGFAYFKETFCALRAVHALRVIAVDGVRIECSLSRKAEAAISHSMAVSTKLPFASQSNKPPSPLLSGMPAHFGESGRKMSPVAHGSYPTAFGGNANNGSSIPNNNGFRFNAPQQSPNMTPLGLEQQWSMRHQAAQQQSLSQFKETRSIDDNGDFFRAPFSQSPNNHYFVKGSTSDDATDSEHSISKGFAAPVSQSIFAQADLDVTSHRYPSKLDQPVNFGLLSAPTNPYSLF
jgi:hypothetical protein